MAKNQAAKNHVVPVIVGPTCTGKTAMALTLGKKFDAIILSADSRQVYKHMNIGTGKFPIDLPAKTNLLSSVSKVPPKTYFTNDVTIFGYDLVTPDKYFSAYDYATYALKKMGELIAAKKKIIIVGGTGLYIDIITGRQSFNGAAPDFELRSQLEKNSTAYLLSLLEKTDPDAFKKVDKKNRYRVVRTLEKKMSKNLGAPLQPPNGIEFKFFGLNASRAYLYARADVWVDTIWENGLIGETKLLLKKFPNSQKLNGLIYKTVIEFFNNKLSKDNTIARIKWDMHAYIRRQQTWFKRNSQIHWFDIADYGTEKCIIEMENIWIKT